MKKRYKKIYYSLILLIIFIMVPSIVEGKTVTVTTAKELKDNLPFTTNDVTDIVLGADIYMTDTVNFYIRTDSSLDLNGYTLTVDTRYDFFIQHHCSNCTMTFKDTSEAKNGKLIIKQNQIYIQPSSGNCLNTSLIIDGGHYEQSNLNTEYSLFRLYKSSGCADYNITESLLIKNGDFKTNRIFYADAKTAQVKVEELTATRSRSDGDFVIGVFNNSLAPNTLTQVIDSNSEVLFDGTLENDLTKNINQYKAENTIVVRKKGNDNQDSTVGDNNNNDNDNNEDDNADNNNNEDSNNNDDNNSNDSTNNNDNNDTNNDNNEDKSNEDKLTTNPKTYDNVVTYFSLFIISTIVLIFIYKRTFNTEN